MSRLLSILVLSLVLTGCGVDDTANAHETKAAQPITYEETIVDNRVTIDGIAYPIASVTETAIAYSPDGQAVEKITRREGDEVKLLLKHEEGQLIEEIGMKNDEEVFKHHYSYQGDRLVEKRTVYPGGLETKTQITYDGQKEIHEHFNADGSRSYLVRATKDEEDRVVELVQETPNGEIVSRTHHTYSGGALTRVTEKRKGVVFRESHFTYNHHGDPITLYQITHAGEDHMLTAQFFDYRYNEDKLPTGVTIHRVQSPIEEAHIRTY